MKKEELIRAVEKEIMEAEGKISLLVENLDTKEILFTYHADDSVVSASMIKVPILLTALELVQEGKLEISTLIEITESTILKDTQVFEYGAGKHTLDELLVWMIINSDNSATNCLIDYLSIERINSFCKKFAFIHTKVERRMLDLDAIKSGYNNYTSAKDMYVMYRALYDKTILTPALCDYAIHILKRQRHKQLSMRYILDDVVVAHKTGGLPHLNHDAGIFYLEEVNYYFGAFVSEVPNNDYAMRWIGRISKLVYEYYKQNPN